MKRTAVISIVAVIAIGGGVAYAVRDLAPSQAAIKESDAFSAVNSKMMTAMMGSAVIYTGDPDSDFVTLAIPDQQNAIEMAAVELEFGTNPDIRRLAQLIASGDQPRVDQLSAWKQGRAVAATPNAATELTAYTTANSKMMYGMMVGGVGQSGNADLDFVKLMIPDRQGAIDIANVELKFGSDPELRAIAQAIVDMGPMEITEMLSWLHANGH